MSGNHSSYQRFNDVIRPITIAVMVTGNFGEACTVQTMKDRVSQSDTLRSKNSRKLVMRLDFYEM